MNMKSYFALNELIICISAHRILKPQLMNRQYATLILLILLNSGISLSQSLNEKSESEFETVYQDLLEPVSRLGYYTKGSAV